MSSPETDIKNCRLSDRINGRNIEFFKTTARSLVYPLSYTLQNFQKNIISTSLLNNTLISLPPGLGKLYIAAIITFNFHRWFLNGRILILSPTRSFLTDLLNAFEDYTSLSKDVYCELAGNAQPKDYISACEKPILLTSPQKLTDLLNEEKFKLQNVVLLLIFETSKITKNDEYKKILEKLGEYDYRLLLFVEPQGFNPKTLRRVVEEFRISKFEVKNCDSPDIIDCTYRTKIDFQFVDISSHIRSIKDAFYGVFEKYAKTLKDAKALSGNVATLTRAQVLKAKEKFKKSTPPNMTEDQKDDLINSMTICAFLCHGIELLHNWGIGVFYSYLFDEEKDADLKTLIVRDKDLMCQMKALNDYLKENGKKIDTSLKLIVHPKLIQLKKIVAQRFDKSNGDVDHVRILIVCSIAEVVDEIDRVFRSLPDDIMYHCIRTNAKCLANEPEHKEIVTNFLDGVIKVLVLSNLVDEVLEVEASLIISLDPFKPLLKTSDVRFFKGASECLFILTKGNEETKFKELWSEKQNEHKPLEVNCVEVFRQESPLMFPEDFNPKFECTGITEPRRNFKNSPAQKTMHHYLRPSEDDVSPLLFEKTDASSRKSKTSRRSDFDNSSLLFGDTAAKSRTNHKSPSKHAFDDEDDFNATDDILEPVLPIDHPQFEESKLKFVDDSVDDLMKNFPEANCQKTVTPSPILSFSKRRHSPAIKFDDDSGDDLILDFSETPILNSVTPASKSGTVQKTLPTKSPVIEPTKKFSWTKKSITPKRIDYDQNSSTTTEKRFQRTVRDDEIFPRSPEPPKKILTVAEIHVDPFNNNDAAKECLKDLKNESFVDCLFDDSSSEEKKKCQNESSSFWSRIDLDKIEVEHIPGEKKAVKDVKISESYVDDLFADDFDWPTTSKSSPKKNAVESDYDSDIIPDSPKEAPSSRIFSARSTQSQTSQGVKRSLYGDLFPNSATTTTTSLNSSFSRGRLSDYVSMKANATITNGFNDIPGDFLKDPVVTDKTPSRSVSPSFVGKDASKSRISLGQSVKSSDISLRCDESSRPQSTLKNASSSSGCVSTSIRTDEAPSVDGSVSPVLFSARKSVRERSRLSLSCNQSASIRFESTLNVSENQLHHLDEIVAVKSKPSPKSSFVESLFEDDDLFSNLSDIERAALSKGKSESKDSGFANASKSFKDCSSSTPKIGNGVINCKTSDRRIVRSNESTPDDILLDDYSTPEMIRTNRLQNERSTKLSSNVSSYFAKPQKSRSIDFSDSTFSLSDFTLNGIELKGKSTVFDSDTASSANRTSRQKEEQTSAATISTMERLNKINSEKRSDSSSVYVKNTSSNSRFPNLLGSKGTSLFKETINKRMQMKSSKILNSSPRLVIDSDEEFIWETSPINVAGFKKPEPRVAKKESSSRHSTPTSVKNSDTEVWSNSPEARAKKPRLPRKRSRLKRNLAEQFLDKEAEVSGDEDEDDDDELHNVSQYSMDSFIDDEVASKPPNMTNYLKSLKSPGNRVGKFHIPVLSDSRLKMNVYSQVEDNNQSYENDSFCVDDESESEANEYVPSALTQAEIKLKRRQLLKNATRKMKRNSFKRIRMIRDSSPDSPQVHNRKTTSKYKFSISSSDSE